MNNNEIRHQSIAASAGSGKTFQLAHRYIRLLSEGVPPDRIIALTFSRKAAGEIFDSIIGYLCAAAASPEEADRTSRRAGISALGQEGFRVLLRELLDSLHRLHISTLDSFIVGVARAFPLELGISASFQVLDENGTAAQRAWHEVLAGLFEHGCVSRAARQELLADFRQATFGRQEKNLEHKLESFIRKYLGYYRILPASRAWGQEQVLWPDGFPWQPEQGSVEIAADELEKLLAQDNLSDNALNRWRSFLDGVKGFGSDSPWSKEVEYLFKKLATDMEGLRKGEASVHINKKEYGLSREECQLALVLVEHIMATEIQSAMAETRGIYRFLDRYESFYDGMMRRQGRLTFTDIQYLLTGANRYTGGGVLSRQPGGDSAHLYIDYRLDAKLDHWLLDEFQDTSDLQWEVLRNLVDEILQDDSRQRSFFYVGDVKQAIYGWRGGNVWLFGNILALYGGSIEQKVLSTSFRSAQPVIDMVNRVFSLLPEDRLSKEVVERWGKIWQEHHCQEGAVPEKGYAALLEPCCSEGQGGVDDEARYDLVACLLKKIEPVRRGLSTAVLVRTNKCGREIADFLRRECPGVNIVHEGRAVLMDNPVVSLLLALVRFAAHPGDTFAWRHLEMSPLGSYFVRERLTREVLSLVLLHEIQENGFRLFLRHWGKKLDEVCGLDAFGRKRLADMVNAASEFDNGGERDCNAFCQFINSYEIHESPGSNAVRIMTIHQAKGLGFDVVILPDLQKVDMATALHSDFILKRDQMEKPEWMLKTPRKVVARNDAVLAPCLQAADEAACFDSLCVLYVALTRARQGLYLITSPPARNASSFPPAAFLRMQLGGEKQTEESLSGTVGGGKCNCFYERGERYWYEEEKKEGVEGGKEKEAELPAGFNEFPSRRRALLNVIPSAETRMGKSAGLLFAKAARGGRELGVAIHELFERVPWYGEVDEEELIREWFASSMAGREVKEKAVEQFRRALKSVDVQQALSRPHGDAWLWRERRFEVVLDDRWLTGIFDRVVIVRDERGKALSATVVDFKSDEVVFALEVPERAEKHRAQMSLYRDALSRILQIAPDQITLRLLFTCPGKVYDFP